MQKFCLLCVVFLLSTSSTFANSIHSYQEFASALRGGEHFVIHADLQECTGKSSMPIAYFIPTKMMLIPAVGPNPERIVTSDLHFTDHTGNPTYEYVKYTFNSDDSVEIRTVIYDPLILKPIGTEHIIKGTLNKEITIHTSSVN